MSVPRIIAELASTSEELSTGDLSVCAFGQHAHVGDIAAVNILIDTAGQYRSGDYTIPGITGVAMSLDNITYGAAGADLVVPGPLTENVRTVYLSPTATVAPAPQMRLPQNGIIDHPSATGTVAVVVGASGAVYVIYPVTGSIIATAIPACALQGQAAAGTAVCAATATGAATISLGNVTNFAASVSGTTNSLSWTAVSGADHYIIQRGTDGVTYGTTLTPNPTGTTFSDTGRSADTTYYYRIKAYNAAETIASPSYATCGGAVQKLFTVAHSVEIRSTAATWAGARAGSGTKTINAADPASEAWVGTLLDTGTYYCERHAMEFVTTAIPAGATVSEALLSLTNTFNHAGGSGGWAFQKGTYSNSPAQATDFASIDATDHGGPTSSPTLNTAVDQTITTPSSLVTVNGTTRIFITDRTRDLGNVAPTGSSNFGNNQAGAGYATTGKRPQLKVSYSF